MNILSLDGGGIRCFVQGLILKEIELKTGKSINQLFDLIVGTSGGAINACAIRSGFTPDDLIEFYLGNKGKKIFEPYLLPLHKSKYNSKNIQGVLFEMFKCKRIKNVKPLMIPIYDLKSRNTYLFNSYETNHEELYLHDLALGSAAAPYYFEPYVFDKYVCMDGGISANNPSLLAYAKIKELFPKEELIFCSLGSGSFTTEIKKDWISIFNPIKLVSSLIECFMDGNSDCVQMASDNILGNNYYRFQLSLNKSNASLDNLTTENIKALTELTNEYLRNDWKSELESLCLKLI